MTSGFWPPLDSTPGHRRDLMQHLAEHGVSARRSPPSKAFLRSVKRVGNLGPGRPTSISHSNGVAGLACS